MSSFFFPVPQYEPQQSDNIWVSPDDIWVDPYAQPPELAFDEAAFVGRSGVPIDNSVPDNVALAIRDVPLDASIAFDAPLPLSNAEFDLNVSHAIEDGDPFGAIKAYGRQVDAAVLSGNPCIHDSHTQRQANCKDCSAVAFSRIHKKHVAGLSQDEKSKAHKADMPRLDVFLEWVAMKKAENAGIVEPKQFNEFVEKELKGQVPVRVCNNTIAKHFVKSSFHISEKGLLCWGDGTGRQRQIRLADGSKCQGVILRDYEVAVLAHEIHQERHCGRDTLVAKIQQRGYKPPVKAVISDWIKDCPGCRHGSSKRSPDSTPAMVSGPPPKRQKAAPRKTKAAAAPRKKAAAAPRKKAAAAPRASKKKATGALVPTPSRGPSEAAPFPPTPAAPATTAEPPQEAPLDNSGIAPLEFLLEGFDEAAFNLSVQQAAVASDTLENTQPSPAGAQDLFEGSEDLETRLRNELLAFGCFA